MTLFNAKIPKKIISAAVLISLLAQLPNLYAWLKTPPGWWFSGFASYFSPVDINTYLTTMRQGFNGHWLWQNHFSAEATASYPLYQFYLLLGHLARWTKLPLAAVFHLSSFVLSIAFLLLLYAVISHFWEEEKLRFFSFFLISLGGGIGWASLGLFPDVTHRETTVFPTLSLPHFVLDELLFLLVVFGFFLAIKRREQHRLILPTVSGFFLATIHPYSLVVAIVVLAGYVFLSGRRRHDLKNRLKFSTPFFVASALPLAFFYYLFYLQGDPVLDEWLRQQIIPSPPFPILLLSYGVLSLLSLVGLKFLWHKQSEEGFFLISWLILHLALTYLPVRFQLLMIKSFFIVLGLVATIGVRRLQLVKKENLLFLLALSLINLPLLLLAQLTLLPERTSLVYLTAEEGESFQWIRQNVPPESLFLTAYISGNFLPAQTTSRSYFGHGIFTVNFEHKKNLVKQFFAGKMNSGERQRFLDANGIDYVYYGVDERYLGEAQLLNQPFLKKVYQNEQVSIYKVL